MVLGAFVTYVSRSSRAAQPRTSTAFLRAGADFGGGFFPLPLCCWPAVVSGGRVWCVASSRSYRRFRSYRRLKPLSIHTISRARMQTSSLEFYHTQSPRGLQHSTTHRSQAAHTRARKKTRRATPEWQLPRLFITAAATATRMATRPGILVASVDHELEDCSPAGDDDLQDKSARHGRSASGSGR